MKKYIARVIVVVTAAALTAFTAAILLVVDNMNKSAAKDNAVNILQIVAASLEESGGGLEQYQKAARYSDDAKSVRITVIDLDGTVLADTLSGDASDMENHSGRKEFIDALKGGVGSDARRSESFGSKYLYAARLAKTGGGVSVVVRVAVEIKTVNGYVYGVLIAAAAIFAAVLLVVGVVSPSVARRALAPVGFVRERLQGVLSQTGNGAEAVSVTKYGDVNAMLADIDAIGKKIKKSITDSRTDRQKLNFIIENINQGVITLSKDKRITLCNGAAAKYFDIPIGVKDELTGYIKNRAFGENLEKAVTLGQTAAFDMTTDGGAILETRLIPAASDGLSVIVTAADVTTARKLAAEKQEFFANASHELNTPLSSILGYSEIMLVGGAIERGFLETVNKEASRMKSLIADMLQIADLEGYKVVEDEAVNVKDIAERVSLSYAPVAFAKKITLKTSLKDGVIFANGEKITELISNLVDNAIKYNNQNGSVEICTEDLGGRVVLTVKDTGIGIPQEYIGRVFERFFRVDKGRSKSVGGTGLGLSIVKHIATRYNAEISIESAERAGTTIRVAFKK
ncbi:MAG: hypothetical protein LBQ40_01505 [Clostridiales bacterium]|jgi:two-component system phosphate regulon sensor histidine kinase PhoR|nr:hypothetical protein [Clostridiales bacterium]